MPDLCYQIITLIINLFIAIGTCGAVLVSLGLFKKKEKLEGVYWAYENYIRVHIINKSDMNCILEKDSSLWITMGKNTAEVRTEPLPAQVVIPANLSCSVHYDISENVHKILSMCANNDLYLYTQMGTLIKLKKGMSGPITKIELVEDQTQTE